ncbi:MAG: prepilin-type N-terminal cleavage/methylation domain-containing protein [Kiritimatiellae bacterium]|nr:prepilin-type N-terminal cleavage/methylation domain-containing protein [Kiritimatiellia bacterium]
MRHTHGHHKGFSLIELVLVIAVIAIASIVVVPQFFRSMRGNRLRAAARSIIVAGRYARSMAVMKQQAMVMEFNLDRSEISVRPARAKTEEPIAPDADDAFTTSVIPDATPAVLTEDVNSEDIEGTGDAEIKRLLDRVTIVSVDVDGVEAMEQDNIVTIQYGNNGRCTPYSVLIKDEFDTAIRVDVDHLAGIETERLEL